MSTNYGNTQLLESSLTSAVYTNVTWTFTKSDYTIGNDYLYLAYVTITGGNTGDNVYINDFTIIQTASVENNIVIDPIFTEATPASINAAYIFTPTKT
jgi:acetyltransferase-like isoleucine patch superfamily enzyme